MGKRDVEKVLTFNNYEWDVVPMEGGNAMLIIGCGDTNYNLPMSAETVLNLRAKLSPIIQPGG